MQSVILKFFAGIFHSLAAWFDASLTGRLFNKISAFLAAAFSDSLPGRFFSGKGEDSWFSQSLFGKILLFPLSLCKRIAQKTETFGKNLCASSQVIWVLSAWHSISIRVYGVFLAAGAEGEAGRGEVTKIQSSDEEALAGGADFHEGT